MYGSGYKFLEYTTFILMKSTHMCHLLFAFRTKTILTIQVGYFVPVMNLMSDSLLTSSLMACHFSLPTFRFLYATSFVEGWIARGWFNFNVYPRYVWGSPCERVCIFNESAFLMYDFKESFILNEWDNLVGIIVNVFSMRH